MLASSSLSVSAKTADKRVGGGGFYARSCCYHHFLRHVCFGPHVRPRLRPIERNTAVILNAFLLAISAGLLLYLIYALLYPEKF